MSRKFALVSHTFPPSWSGQAVILGRILRHLDPASYHLISRQDYQDDTHDFIPRLAGAYHHLPPEPQLRPPLFAQQCMKPNFILAALARGRRIASLVRQNGCQAVIACTGDITDMPAGWLASRLARVPFIPYLFDDFTYQWPLGPYRDMAAFFERIMYRRVAGVIVPNEMLGAEIERRHNISCSIVRNCCDKPPLAAKNLASLADQKQIRIVFTGAIYHMNFGSFRMLIEAIRRLNHPGVTLHLYTATEPSILAEQGILGPQVEYHPHIPSDQVSQVQQEADLLYVPFAFDTPVWELAKTSAPGKLGDYLASGTPILGMAPPDSFVTWYLRSHEAGLVVDRDDRAFLDDSLQKVLFDDGMRQALSASACRSAAQDFCPQKAAQDFLAVVESAS